MWGNLTETVSTSTLNTQSTSNTLIIKYRWTSVSVTCRCVTKSVQQSPDEPEEENSQRERGGAAQTGGENTRSQSSHLNLGPIGPSFHLNNHFHLNCVRVWRRRRSSRAQGGKRRRERRRRNRRKRRQKERRSMTRKSLKRWENQYDQNQNSVLVHQHHQSGLVWSKTVTELKPVLSEIKVSRWQVKSWLLFSVQRTNKPKWIHHKHDVKPTV